MRAPGLVAALIAAPLHAAPWSFGDPLTVAEGGDCFHHLDGASRQHVAASAQSVALVWEDDCDGSPQVYFAEAVLGGRFGEPLKLSGGGEAFEPAVIALGTKGWLAAWEQDGGIWARLVDPAGAGEAVRWADDGARQVSLARSDDGALAAAWARDRDGGQLIEVADVEVAGRRAEPVAVKAMPAAGEHPYQGHPALVFARGGRLVLAFEDRRAGHTRLFSAYRDPGAAFLPERQLNEHRAPASGAADSEQGLGSGVMRVTLASDGDGTIHAAWLDKRNPASGYAVWGAMSDDRGATFSVNAKIQDELGDAVQQWHASIAGLASGFVAAWDDSRERWLDESEYADVYLSWTTADGWSDDFRVPGASGEGYQGNPALAVDPHGGLHLMWIDRITVNARTTLRYLHAPAD